MEAGRRKEVPPPSREVSMNDEGSCQVEGGLPLAASAAEKTRWGRERIVRVVPEVGAAGEAHVDRWGNRELLHVAANLSGIEPSVSKEMRLVWKP